MIRTMFRVVVVVLVLSLRQCQAFVLPGRAFTTSRCFMVETVAATAEGEVGEDAATTEDKPSMAPEGTVSMVTEDSTSMVPDATKVEGAGVASKRTISRERHTLFIGNISFETTEDDLKSMCEAFGKVDLVNIPKDRATEQPRGFAFVDMGTAEELEAAVSGLDGRQVSGRVIRANKSLPKGEKAAKSKDNDSSRLPAGIKKLYVGNTPFQITKEEVADYFKDYGEIYEIYIPVNPATGDGRGFAFVTLKEEEADRAIEELNGADFHGRRLVVSVPLQPGDKLARKPRGPQRMKIYVGNLSFYTVPETLAEVFGEFGEVYDCYLPEDRVSGGSRGFGFVTMARDDAERAIANLNGVEIDGREITVNEAQAQTKPRAWSADTGSADAGYDFPE